MSHDYPWPKPSQREQIVVRQRPFTGGDKPEDVVVVEWSGEQFTHIRPADKSEQR